MTARSSAATRSRRRGRSPCRITAFGAVPSGRMAARTGVRPGDRLYVTGTIGDAAIGLRFRQGRGPDIPQADRDFLLDRYLHARAPHRRWRPAMARACAWRHGRFRRLRRRPDQDAGRLGRDRPRADLTACRCRPPRAPRSPPIRTCSRLPRPAATIMNSSASVAPEAARAFEAEASRRGGPRHFRRRGGRRRTGRRVSSDRTGGR